MAAQNGCLYVYGGLASVGSDQRSETVFRAQLQAPPLLEAAWGAFTGHCPTLSSGQIPNSMDLLAAGVPRNMMKRLVRLPKKSNNL